MKSISKHSDKEKFWREQLRSFAKFKGSRRAFCRIHGLSASTFQYWHCKYSQIKRCDVQVVEPSPFVEVEVESQVRSSSRNMPDARWVAELILHLQEGLR